MPSSLENRRHRNRSEGLCYERVGNPSLGCQNFLSINDDWKRAHHVQTWSACTNRLKQQGLSQRCNKGLGLRVGRVGPRGGQHEEDIGDPIKAGRFSEEHSWIAAPQAAPTNSLVHLAVPPLLIKIPAARKTRQSAARRK